MRPIAPTPHASPFAAMPTLPAWIRAMEHPRPALVDVDDGANVGAVCRAIRRGDEAAFTAFYEREFDRLLATTLAFTKRDEHYALDIVQDVMLRVIHGLPELATRGELVVWLRRAMASCVIDRVRQDARRTRREGRVARGEATSDERAEAVWLRERLRELDEEDRAVLTLRYGMDLTLEQAAVAEGVTPGTVHGRVRRALARLRRLIEGGGA